MTTTWTKSVHIVYIRCFTAFLQQEDHPVSQWKLRVSHYIGEPCHLLWLMTQLSNFKSNRFNWACEPPVGSGWSGAPVTAQSSALLPRPVVAAAYWCWRRRTIGRVAAPTLDGGHCCRRVTGFEAPVDTPVGVLAPLHHAKGLRPLAERRIMIAIAFFFAVWLCYALPQLLPTLTSNTWCLLTWLTVKSFLPFPTGSAIYLLGAGAFWSPWGSKSKDFIFPKFWPPNFGGSKIFVGVDSACQGPPLCQIWWP